MKPKGAIIWKDTITGTIYYLDKDKASKISVKGIEYINSIDDIDELYSYMSGEKAVEDEEVSMFPQLPYIIGDDEVCAYRISDHVIIRTGILYSIFKDKNYIRRYGLMENIDIFCDKDILVKVKVDNKVREITKLIDKVLMGKEVDKNESEKIKFDLLKGGTVKIKQYFLETNKIKDIRGASAILDDLNRDIIPNYIKENYIGECIVYAGGGNILGIFPQGEGQKLSEIIEQKHEIESITAQCCASYKRCTLFDLAVNNYKHTMSELEFMVNDRQMSKFDFREDIKLKDKNIGKYKELREKHICEHCNIRYAHFKGFPEGKLCSSCLKKVLKGGTESKNNFKEQFHKFAISHGLKVDKLKNINSLTDIGDFIGIIYGDGNNMGDIVQRIANLGQMRYFSNKTEDAIFDVVYNALAKVLKDDGFEIIAIGGDDIFIIVPAEKALEIGIEIGEGFDNLFRNKSENRYTTTMSLGIAISHYNTPIQYLFDLSQQLLKNAKKKSKKMDGLGTVDIMALETDKGVGSSLKFIRKHMVNGNINLTLKPYTWGQARAIQSSILKLKQSKARSKAYSFRDISYYMGLSEGELFYLYQMKRMENRNEKDTEAIKYSLKTIGEAFDLQERALNLSTLDKNNKEIYSPWDDIVELWDYS